MKTIRIVLFPFSSVLYNHCVHSISSRPFLHTQDMYFVFVQLLSSGSAWFAIIIIVITCLFPDVVKKVFYRHLLPTSTQKSQVTWEEGREDLYRFFWWERWYRSWAICLTRIKLFFCMKYSLYLKLSFYLSEVPKGFNCNLLAWLQVTVYSHRSFSRLFVIELLSDLHGLRKEQRSTIAYWVNIWLWVAIYSSQESCHITMLYGTSTSCRNAELDLLLNPTCITKRKLYFLKCDKSLEGENKLECHSNSNSRQGEKMFCVPRCLNS